MSDPVYAVFKEVVQHNLDQAREYAEMIVGLGEIGPQNAFDANALNSGLSVALATLSIMVQARDNPPPLELITAIGMTVQDFELLEPAAALCQQTNNALQKVLKPAG